MRLAYLDCMRLVAAMTVLLQHLLEAADPVRFAPLLGLGPGVFGVVLFFFLSGYVIPMSIRGEFLLADFALRRAFRIFPAYLVVMAALVALGSAAVPPWSEVLARGGGEALLANFALVQDYTGQPAFLGVSWTLSLEFIWYAGFAAAMLVFGREHAVALALAGSAGLVLLALVSMAIAVRLPLGRVGMLDAALLGYAACRLHEGAASPRGFGLALVAFVVASGAAQLVAFGVFAHPRVALATGLIAWGAATVAFVGFIRMRDRAIGPIGSAAAGIGRISYSIYLVHGPVIALWIWAHGTRGLLVAAPFITLGLSLLLYRWVELPGIAMGRRAAARLTSPPVGIRG